MVKIINPLHSVSPIAQTLSGLGNSLFGDQVSGDIKREQLYALQRQNVETENLMRMIAGEGGAQALGANPVAQALILGSGYKPGDFADMGLMGAATGYGARDPRTTNWVVGSGRPFSSTADAFDATLAETMRDNDMQSADRRYGVDVGSVDRRFATGVESADRRYSTDQTRAQNQAEFAATPQEALVGGVPTFVPRQALYNPVPVPQATPVVQAQDMLGLPAPTAMPQPILSNTERQGTLAGNSGDFSGLTPNQQAYIGADLNGGSAGGIKNYVMPDGTVYLTRDGKINLQTDERLPLGGHLANVMGSADETGLTTAVKTGLQNADIGAKEWAATRDQALAVARDPTMFGASGNVRYGIQQVGEIARNLGLLTSTQDVDQEVAAVLPELNENVQALIMRDLTTPDPQLRALRSLRVLLAYQAAKANGSSGRDLSDKEMQANLDAIGDPTSWLASQDTFLAGLATLDYNIAARRNARVPPAERQPLPPFNEFLADFLANAKGGAQAPAASPAAPQTAVNPQTGERRQLDPSTRQWVPVP